jgi:hypothetical protein
MTHKYLVPPNKIIRPTNLAPAIGASLSYNINLILSVLSVDRVLPRTAGLSHVLKFVLRSKKSCALLETCVFTDRLG